MQMREKKIGLAFSVGAILVLVILCVVCYNIDSFDHDIKMLISENKYHYIVLMIVVWIGTFFASCISAVKFYEEIVEIKKRIEANEFVVAKLTDTEKVEIAPKWYANAEKFIIAHKGKSNKSIIYFARLACDKDWKSQSVATELKQEDCINIESLSIMDEDAVKQIFQEGEITVLIEIQYPKTEHTEAVNFGKIILASEFFRDYEIVSKANNN